MKAKNNKKGSTPVNNSRKKGSLLSKIAGWLLLFWLIFGILSGILFIFVENDFLKSISVLLCGIAFISSFVLYGIDDKLNPPPTVFQSDKDAMDRSETGYFGKYM